MIKELSDIQRSNILRKKDEHLKMHLSPKESTFAEVEKNVGNMYEIMGKDKPRVIFYLNSPMSCLLAINLPQWNLGSQLESQLDSQLYSQLDSQLDSRAESQNLKNPGTTTDYFWRSYYSFYQILLEEVFPDRIKDFPLLNTTMDFFKHCPITYLFDDIAFVSKAPKTSWQNNVLHNELGKSVEFSDGWGFYSLNGVVVDEYFVKTPKHEIDTTRVLALENAEQRMTLIKYIGMDKFLNSFENKVIETKFMDKKYDLVYDSKDYYCEYNLIDIKIEDEMCRFLKMSNFSTKEWHVEGVPNDVTSVEHALAWREGEDSYIKPQGVA